MIEIKCVDEARERYEMTDRGEVIGRAELCSEGETTQVLSCDAPSVPLVDALFRAVLNAARAKDARFAVTTDDSLVKHMEKKGYAAELEDGRLEIDKFFSKFVCNG